MAELTRRRFIKQSTVGAAAFVAVGVALLLDRSPASWVGPGSPPPAAAPAIPMTRKKAATPPGMRKRFFLNQGRCAGGEYPVEKALVAPVFAVTGGVWPPPGAKCSVHCVPSQYL